MDNVLQLTNLFLMVLLLALLVERIMEVLTGIWDFVEWKGNYYRIWQAKAKKLKNNFESKAKSQILLKVIDLTPLTRQINYATRSDKTGHSGKLTIISEQMIRQSWVAGVSRVVATAIGFAFCWWTNVNFVEVFETAMEMTPGTLTSLPHGLQMFVSGAVIGLGSEPVHSIITNLEKQRKERREKRAKDLALQKGLQAAKNR